MRGLTAKIRKNYTHHTTTNKPQTIHTFSCGGCSRPLYSSHTTPHTTLGKPLLHSNSLPSPVVSIRTNPNKWIVVQDTQQCTNDLPRKIMLLYVLHRIPVTNPSMVGSVFPLRFNNGGMTTLGPSTTNISNQETSRRYVLKLKLLRKEVIQPHLPVRLPCYDFVPIADPTFDSSLTSLGHWLRVLPTFMT